MIIIEHTHLTIAKLKDIIRDLPEDWIISQEGLHSNFGGAFKVAKGICIGPPPLEQHPPSSLNKDKLQ